ncbi:MAG: UDP-3-O-[3-hydroxymyristoyl] N-acetylglucosamine deacetylase [Deltaproteobacteria bacterium]|nr:UDP-3-O-[3-hydroxymyristoyl] N-acetylglucosamine deacetylase [Deltaproteobacteria bacterium]MBI2538766.1 UDP-3-O-[3-hydroxymyristoyl] N-acetylglucosamine deacetylase [Deltaproteobacteria bacterium]
MLIVDDEEGIRESVREILSDEGYRVIEASDGTTVLELIRKERPRLVLLDIWMPQVDGIGLLKEIKEQEPEVNVIMISGHGNIHTAVAAAKLGAFDFIEKPLSLDGLLLTVRRALGGSPPSKGNGKSLKTARGKRRSRVSAAAAAARSLKQKTLGKSVVISGQGLHSGIKTGVILHPLPPNSGILFSGISADTTVPAHLDYVGSTGYATSLRGKGIVVGTVEHFLAVLHSYGITNLLVKMHGEIPIMDGSALDFCHLIEEAGLQEQDEEWSEIVIDRTYRVGPKGGETISVEPADTFGVRYVLNYPKPIGLQEHTYLYKGPESFKAEIAPARTFGFLKDIEKLEKLGLVNGGRLSNCILMDNEKILNTELRFADEFARHKILDIVGDFYLLGRPIRGMVTARMTGHSDNIALLRQIRKGMDL